MNAICLRCVEEGNRRVEAIVVITAPAPRCPCYTDRGVLALCAEHLETHELTCRPTAGACYVPGCDRGPHCSVDDLPASSPLHSAHFWLDPRPAAEDGQMLAVISWLEGEDPVDGGALYKFRRVKGVHKAARLLRKAYRRWWRDWAFDNADLPRRDVTRERA